MADKRFDLELPEEVLAGFDWQDADVPYKVREALVMDLLRLDRISEAQAAELLQLDRWALLDIMGCYRVPAIRMSPEELRQELTQEIQQSPGI